jgi:hypothetical protein
MKELSSTERILLILETRISRSISERFENMLIQYSCEGIIKITVLKPPLKPVW